MGSEIVVLFGPLALMAIFALVYLAGVPRFRISAIVCFVVSAAASYCAVEGSPNYSFWTYAGFYGFVFVVASIVLLPILFGISALLSRRSPASGNVA